MSILHADALSPSHRDPLAPRADPLEALLVKHLERRRPEVAARVVLEARAKRMLPPDAELRGWLRDVVGEIGFAQIIDGFARMKSPCCSNGFEPCEACEGGRVAGPCLACAGLGQIRCSFCNATGLLQYEALPDGLLLDILHRRTLILRDALHRLAETAKANADQTDHPTCTPEERMALATRLVHGAQKLLGAVENATLKLGEWRDRAPKADARLAPVLKRVATTARDGQLAELQALSDAWASRAAREPHDGDAGEHARAMAAFYERLATPGALAGTGLAHPFLFDEDRGGLPPAPAASLPGGPAGTF